YQLRILAGQQNIVERFAILVADTSVRELDRVVQAGGLAKVRPRTGRVVVAIIGTRHDLAACRREKRRLGARTQHGSVDVVRGKLAVEIVPETIGIVGGVLQSLLTAHHPQWRLLPKRAGLPGGAMWADSVVVQTGRHHVARERTFDLLFHQVRARDSGGLE